MVGRLRQLRPRIGTKVCAALAAPLLALLATGLISVADVRRTAQRATDEASLATSIVGPGTLINALQAERSVVAFDLVGLDAAIVGIAGQDPAGAIETTDGRLSDFVHLVGSRGEGVEAVFTPALAALDALDEIRSDARRFDGPRGFANIGFSKEIFGRYTAVVEEIVDANTRLALSLEDVTLRNGAELIKLSNRQEDLAARIVAEVLFAAFGHGGLRQRGDLVAVSTLLSRLHANEPRLWAHARGDYAEPTEAYLTADHVVRFPEVVGEAIDTGRPVLIDPVGGTGILDNADVRDRDLADGYTHTSYQAEVGQILEQRASVLKDRARRTQIHYLGFGTLGLLAVATVTYLVARSITRPLRALTRQATDMAHGLPDAVVSILGTPAGDDVIVPHVEHITVRTRDEVVDVADALNIVQDSALDLAVGQAVLRRNIADSFGNLGRRNQNLLSRQLDFITDLERDETDPDALANLFRLDHLATRLRRNAASLVVLAELDPPRRPAAPVSITDVIRAALGEVEDYRRVGVRAVEPTGILGSAVPDLTHLLAELIENALVFSPSDRAVVIVGSHRTSAYAPDHRGAGRGYGLSIIDAGLGLPPDELVRANRRLAGTESLTVAPSKYLGHYVAGHLGARHDITVRLHNSPGTGVTAHVHLPPDLLVGEARADRTTSHTTLTLDRGRGATGEAVAGER